MRVRLKLFSILVLLASTVAAHAGIFIIEVHVNRSDECKSGYSFYFDGGPTYCLSPKGKKIDLSSLEGQTVKLGGEYKNIHGVPSFVVAKLNPSGAPNTYKATGLTGFLAAANPYVQGASAALSGGSVAQPAPVVYSTPPETPVYTPQGVQGSNFVPGVPQCGQSTYVNGYFTVVNACEIAVTITWTSAGDVWGAANLGPRGQSNTGQTASNVSRAGGVDLFTCPGITGAEDTQGNPVGTHYKGPYRCRK
jgi:hypothetical protein